MSPLWRLAGAVAAAGVLAIAANLIAIRIQADVEAQLAAARRRAGLGGSS